MITDEVKALRAVIVRQAVAAPGQAKFLAGQPLRELARLVHQHGAEAVRATIDQAGDQALSPLRMVELVGNLLLLEELGDEGPALVVPDAVDARRAVAHLEQLVATYEANGAEAPSSIVSELARWQDEVIAVTPQEAMA